jgi:hypothetical protein
VLNGFVVTEFGYCKAHGFEQGFGVYVNGVANSFGVGVGNAVTAHWGIISSSLFLCPSVNGF